MSDYFEKMLVNLDRNQFSLELNSDFFFIENLDFNDDLQRAKRAQVALQNFTNKY